MSDSTVELADTLARMGCRSVFGVTGSGPSLRLITELESRGATYYAVAHEAAAGIMAGVVSAATSSPAVGITIKGPGFANLIPGLVLNRFECYPSITLSEAYGTNVPATKMHKRLDQVALAAPVVKVWTDLAGAAQLPSLWRMARGEVPGPLHVDLAHLDGVLPVHRQTEVLSTSPLGPLLDQIRTARRVALIVGSLALRSTWKTRLDTLAVPVFTTVSGRGAVDEGRPHAAGVYTGAGRKNAPETRVLTDADLVIGIGLRNTEVLGTLPISGRVRAVDVVKGSGGGLSEDPVLVNGESGAVDQILDSLESAPGWGAELIAERKAIMLRDPLLHGWLPMACFQILDRLGFDHGLVLDTGSFCTIGEHVWTARRGRVFLGSSNGRYMGVGLPSAIGLCLAHPGLPVFCVVGDGGIAMYLSELRLVTAERLPLCVVFMTDGRFGSIAAGVEWPSTSRRAITVTHPSWQKVMAGFGIEAACVGSEQEFQEVLGSWDRSMPLFIEAPFDPQRYETMTLNLR